MRGPVRTRKLPARAATGISASSGWQRRHREPEVTMPPWRSIATSPLSQAGQIARSRSRVSGVLRQLVAVSAGPDNIAVSMLAQAGCRQGGNNRYVGTSFIV